MSTAFESATRDANGSGGQGVYRPEFYGGDSRSPDGAALRGLARTKTHRRLKLLFVGPFPPPHGGISVHVWNACRVMRSAGTECRVVNIDPRAPASGEYIRISGAASLALALARHALDDWTVHVHTNGHNPK